MNTLWQWHNVTAYGDEAIIRRANILKLYSFMYALAEVAHGYQPVTNIEDAIEYFYASENGVVKDEIVPNEIVCEE
jgi:predicted metalloprotease with PDZ domain